eukprot:jgi/Botrbrau1/3198/Bobra.37_2s0028.1
MGHDHMKSSSTWLICPQAVHAVYVPLILMMLTDLLIVPSYAQGPLPSFTEAPEQAMLQSLQGMASQHQQAPYRHQEAVSLGQPSRLPDQATSFPNQERTPAEQAPLSLNITLASQEGSMQYPDQAITSWQQATPSEGQPSALPNQAASPENAMDREQPKVAAMEEALGSGTEDGNEDGPARDLGGGAPGSQSPWGELDPSRPEADHSQGAPISPYAIVNFQAETRRDRRATLPQPPRIVELPEPAGEDAMHWTEDQIVGSDRGPPPIISFLTDADMAASNHSMATGDRNASRQASFRGGWVQPGAFSIENAAAIGYYLSVSDMAFCAGSGYVLQGVNAMFSIYSAATGARLSGPLGIMDLFKKPVDSKGRGMFDPRCIYDGYNKRFIVIAPRNADAKTVGNGYYSELLVGMSTTSDPRGNWYMYAVDTAYGNPPCSGSAPCWCDFPSLGQDRYGIWIGCNMWKAGGGGLGLKVFALGKQIMLNGGNVVPQQYYNLNPGTWWMQPATTQGTGGDNTNNGGTMYLVSTYGCCALSLYTITNTQLLSSNRGPSIPTAKIIGTQSLQSPPLIVLCGMASLHKLGCEKLP